MKEMSTIASNADMMRDVINYIRRLRRDYGKVKCVDAIPYTMDELNERIDCAEENFKSGHYTTSEQLHQEMKDLLKNK